MSDRPTVIYVYDGSFDGLMCCAYESLRRRERPEAVILADEPQQSMFTPVYVDTDCARAEAVMNKIRAVLGERTLAFIKRVSLTCMENKELALLNFLEKSLSRGKSILGDIASEDVQPMLKAVRHLNNEAELLKGFVRFSDMGEVMVSVIEPKNNVLPLLAHHFCDRFPDARLMIYDKGRGEFLICDAGRSRLGYMDDYEPYQVSDEEKNYRALWQSFYETAAIKERYNPKCRAGHMPKRYWAAMTEFWEREQYIPVKSLAAQGS